jgi:hypothetical protein
MNESFAAAGIHKMFYDKFTNKIMKGDPLPEKYNLKVTITLL